MHDAPVPTSDPTAPDAARRARGTLRVLRAYAAFTYPFACVPFLYFHYADHGVTPAGFATLISAYYVTMVAAEIPTGVLADLRGQRAAMRIGPLVLAAGFAVIGLWPSYPGFYLGQVLLGLGHSILSGPPSALLFRTLKGIGQSADYRRQESVINMLRLLGTGVAFLLGGWLVDRHGIPTAIAATAVACTVASVIAFALAAPPVARSATPGSGQRFHALAHAARDLRRPPVRWMLGYYVLLFFLLRFPFHTYQPFLREANAEDPMWIGVLFFALNLFAAPFSRLTPYLCRRFGLATMLWAMPLLLAVSMAVMAGRVDGFGIALFFLHQVPFGMHWAVVQDYVQHRIDDAARSTVPSVLSFAGRLVFALLFPLTLASGEVADGYLAVGVAGVVLTVVVMAVGRVHARG